MSESNELDEAMQDLAQEDLAVAGDRLYVAALRYTRAYQRHEIDRRLARGRVTLGNAEGLLSAAVQRYDEAYERFAAAFPELGCIHHYDHEDPEASSSGT